MGRDGGSGVTVYPEHLGHSLISHCAAETLYGAATGTCVRPRRPAPQKRHPRICDNGAHAMHHEHDAYACARSKRKGSASERTAKRRLDDPERIPTSKE